MLVRSILASCLLGPPVLPADEPAATAEASGWSPAWSGPSECEGTAALRERIAVLVPNLAVSEVEVRVDVVRRGEDQLGVTVEIASPIGTEQRSFVSPDCATAIDAAALIVAVIVDPLTASEALTSSAATPSIEPEPGRPSPPEPPPAAAEPAPVAEPTPARSGLNVSVTPEREPQPTAPVQVALELFAGGGYGPLTAGSVELAGGVAIVGRGFRVGARAAWLPGLVHTTADDRRVVFAGWHVGARGCGVPRLGLRQRWELPACVGVEAGQVRANPLAPIVNRRSGARPWLAIELGPGLRWLPARTGERLAVGVELAAVIPLLATAFTLDDRAVREYTPVGVRALLGLELRLP